jgi:thioredoxin 1
MKVRGGSGGGEFLYEAETLSEVEDLVLKAAINNQLVVIDFTASWCGPCKAIAPLYRELSDEFGDTVVFVKVDVDENPDTAAKYSVSAMPTFLYIKGGVVVDRLMGANPMKLRELIEEHM